jgi:hypothetical protein
MIHFNSYIQVKCDELGCTFEKSFTPEELDQIKNYDGTSLQDIPGKKARHKMYLAIKENKCPFCSQREHSLQRCCSNMEVR